MKEDYIFLIVLGAMYLLFSLWTLRMAYKAETYISDKVNSWKALIIVSFFPIVHFATLLFCYVALSPDDY